MNSKGYAILGIHVHTSTRTHERTHTRTQIYITENILTATRNGEFLRFIPFTIIRQTDLSK